ncbi:hypothetical protein [Acinetobacter seifertii]|uniref:Uncharacterized protein n=1 Tax=Acinetobacter seifertii TaxID=1530123 RepID=A0A7H2PSU9_9GAMM|nr:hypothetical protein [Acinetobacter seifertii]QNX05932.1 hypothetical protein IC796_02965 [Acinetobacter seifertii]
MLFSEKEIEDLKFCSDIARYLNKYDYKDVVSKKGIQKLYSLHRLCCIKPLTAEFS